MNEKWLDRKKVQTKVETFYRIPKQEVLALLGIPERAEDVVASTSR